MATNLNVYWGKASESANDVKLVQEGRAFGNAHNITGVWDGSYLRYTFTIDIDDTDKYDATLQYEIHDGDPAGAGAKVAENIYFASEQLASDLDTHEADTTAHSATGAVVGTTNAQTLTNKTINGPDNTITNLDGADHKADTQGNEHPSVKVKPAAGTNSVLHVDTSDATSVTIQAADDTKANNKDLNLVAGEIILADKDGGDIQLSGLAAGAASGDAVEYDQLDALDTRVTTLETGGAWVAAPPDVTLRLTSQGRWTVNAYFNVEQSERASVQRWEIYWTYGGLPAVSSPVSAAELIDLQNQANRVLIRGEEGNNLAILADEEIEVMAIAFSSGNIGYASDPTSIVPRGALNPARDGNGQIVEVVQTVASDTTVAANANDNIAAKYIDWVQDDTPLVKLRGTMVYNANQVTLRAKFVSKIAADTGLITLRISEVLASATSEMKAQSYTVIVAAYPDTPDSIEIALSDAGLTAGRLYEIELEANGSAGNNVNVRSDALIELISQVQIY